MHEINNNTTGQENEAEVKVGIAIAPCAHILLPTEITGREGVMIIAEPCTSEEDCAMNIDRWNLWAQIDSCPIRPFIGEMEVPEHAASPKEGAQNLVAAILDSDDFAKALGSAIGRSDAEMNRLINSYSSSGGSDSKRSGKPNLTLLS